MSDAPVVFADWRPAEDGEDVTDLLRGPAGAATFRDLMPPVPTWRPPYMPRVAPDGMDDDEETGSIRPTVTRVSEAAMEDLLRRVMEADEAWERPRWPEGTPGGKGGQFMAVGQVFSSGGKKWQIAHIVKGKVYAHEASAKYDAVETRSFNIKDVGGKPTVPEAAYEPPVAVPKGGKSQSSQIAIVDPYVDPATHDAGIPVPEGSSIDAEQWKRFGKVDQEHYAALMARFGAHKPGKAKAHIDASYAAYSSKVQQLVKAGYKQQYGSSSGYSLSIAAGGKGTYGGAGVHDTPEMAKLREEALALQAEHKAAVQWDLYNRTQSPDVFAVHKDDSHDPSWWDASFVNGDKAIMSGLSQSFSYRASFFGAHAIATPLAIRHVLLSSQSAQPVPGESHFPGELEISVAEQLKVDKRSITFSAPSGYGSSGKKLTATQNQWLEGVTNQPIGGHIIEMLRDSIQNGTKLPTPPAPAHVVMDGQSGKTWVDPPSEATSVLPADKMPGVASSNIDPATLDKDLPWMHLDEQGNPKPVTGKDAGAYSGQYFMGLKGTLYWIGPDPGNQSGYPFRIHKIENGSFNGENFAYNPDLPGYYLSAEYDISAKLEAEGEAPPFNPDEWVNGTEAEFLEDFKTGDKFKVNGTAYEVTGVSGASMAIVELETGKTGKINGNYKSVKLVPLAGKQFTADEGGKWASFGTPRAKNLFPGQNFMDSDGVVYEQVGEHEPGGATEGKPVGWHPVAITQGNLSPTEAAKLVQAGDTKVFVEEIITVVEGTPPTLDFGSAPDPAEMAFKQPPLAVGLAVMTPDGYGTVAALDGDDVTVDMANGYQAEFDKGSLSQWQTPMDAKAGLTFPFYSDGEYKKATVTVVKADGDVQINLKPGKVIIPADEWAAYADKAFDPEAWTVSADKVKLRDMKPGDRFQGSAGNQTLRPYEVLSVPEAGKVTVRNVDTGQVSTMSRHVSYRPLLAKAAPGSAAAGQADLPDDPVASQATPQSTDLAENINPANLEPSGAPILLKDVQAGDVIGGVGQQASMYVKSKDPDGSMVITNLESGNDVPLLADFVETASKAPTWQVFVPKGTAQPSGGDQAGVPVGASWTNPAGVTWTVTGPPGEFGFQTAVTANGTEGEFKSEAIAQYLAQETPDKPFVELDGGKFVEGDYLKIGDMAPGTIFKTLSKKKGVTYYKLSDDGQYTTNLTTGKSYPAKTGWKATAMEPVGRAEQPTPSTDPNTFSSADWEDSGVQTTFADAEVGAILHLPTTGFLYKKINDSEIDPVGVGTGDPEHFHENKAAGPVSPASWSELNVMVPKGELSAPAAPEAKFEEGDSITINSPGSVFDGLPGEVVQVGADPDTGKFAYKVKPEGWTPLWLQASEVQAPDGSQDSPPAPPTGTSTVAVGGLKDKPGQLFVWQNATMSVFADQAATEGDEVFAIDPSGKGWVVPGDASVVLLNGKGATGPMEPGHVGVYQGQKVTVADMQADNEEPGGFVVIELPNGSNETVPGSMIAPLADVQVGDQVEVSWTTAWGVPASKSGIVKSVGPAGVMLHGSQNMYSLPQVTKLAEFPYKPGDQVEAPGGVVGTFKGFETAATGKTYAAVDVSGDDDAFAFSPESLKLASAPAPEPSGVVMTPKADAPVPADALQPGDATLLGKLGAGDRFKYATGPHVYEVVEPPSDVNGGGQYAIVYEDGSVGAPFYAAVLNASSDVTLESKAGEAIKQPPVVTTAVDWESLPDASVEGGLVGYKSHKGSGGKWSHHMIKTMPEGVVFADLNGKQWKVKAAGDKPVITDGESLFKVNGSVRGKDLNQPAVKQSATLIDNTSAGAPELPPVESDTPTPMPGVIAGGKSGSLTGAAGPYVEVTTEDGVEVHKPENVTPADPVPEEQPPSASAAPSLFTQATPTAQLTVGDKFTSAPGSTKVKTAIEVTSDTVFWSDDAGNEGSYSTMGAFGGTVYTEPAPPETPAAPEPESQTVKLIGVGWHPAKPWGEFEAGDKVVFNYGSTYTVAGKQQEGPWTTLTLQDASGKVVSDRKHKSTTLMGWAEPEPPAEVEQPVDPAVIDAVGSLDDFADPVEVPVDPPVEPTPVQTPGADPAPGALQPFASRLGPGGIYKHDRLSELQVGQLFTDKTGTDYKLVGQGEGMATYQDVGTGKVYAAPSGQRVKRTALPPNPGPGVASVLESLIEQYGGLENVPTEALMGYTSATGESGKVKYPRLGHLKTGDYAEDADGTMLLFVASWLDKALVHVNNADGYRIVPAGTRVRKLNTTA